MKSINKEQIANIFFHPLLIAIPFAMITIYLFPLDFSKISFQTFSTNLTHKNGNHTIQHYEDLDGDGRDEEISHFTNAINQCAIKIRDAHRINIGQWNFNGFLPDKSTNLVFLDYNNDGILDVFTLYQRADSVFLGGINPENDSSKLLEDFFVAKIQVVNNQIDFSSKLDNYDLDKDGTEEIIITISAGYSEQPRKIYAYNFINNTLKSSPPMGFVNGDLSFSDLDGDGNVEIIPITISLENIEKHTGILFNDYERWFVVYDHELNFKFGPVSLGMGSGNQCPFVFETDSVPFVLICDRNAEVREMYSFYLFDIKTGALKKVHLDFDNCEKTGIDVYEINKEKLIAAHNFETGEIKFFDPLHHFKLAGEMKIQPGLVPLKSLDINNDGETEHIYHTAREGEKYIVIYTSNLEYSFEYAVPANFSGITNITTCSGSNNQNHLVLQFGENITELEFSYNRFYLLQKAALYVFIFGFYVALIWLVLFYHRKILRKRYERAQLISELKLKTIRNQMDPHFTFNAINAIASAIYKEDKVNAYNYFSVFSKLIRSTMLYSDQMSRTLEEEVDFTMKYLQIEKFRFREKFNYQLKIDDDVNVNMEVPRMIIQTFAESAVANGLMHRRENGWLKIQIRNDKENLVATFDDNGVGIEASKKFNREKAFKSIKIMDEFIRIFNDLNRTKISYEMFDIEKEGEFPGTRVIVRLPKIFKYNYRRNY